MPCIYKIAYGIPGILISLRRLIRQTMYGTMYIGIRKRTHLIPFIQYGPYSLGSRSIVEIHEILAVHLSG